VLTASEVGMRGHEGVFQVKQNSALYPKSFIEEAFKEAPGGVRIVLKGSAPNGVPLIAFGYCYSRKTTLYFVATENSGSTVKSESYVMKYTDSYGNICTRLVDRPNMTLIRINVVDTYHLSSWHGIINYSRKDDKKLSVCTFAGILSHQLILQCERLSYSDEPVFLNDSEPLLLQGTTIITHKGSPRTSISLQHWM
jgi:hypothetical protein